ncbi:MAG: methyltransferase domain-containing protein [Candidatus Micrarchaeota archaeon]
MHVSAWYDKAAVKYATFRRPQKEFEAIDHFLSPSQRRILDAGCGHGDVSRYMASKGKAVTAIDVSTELIRIAGSMRAKGCSFQVADMQQFQPDAGTLFDGAVFLYSLIHNTKDETVSILRRTSQFLNPTYSSLFVVLHNINLYSGCVTRVVVPSQFSDDQVELYLWPMKEIYQVFFDLGMRSIEISVRQPESNELPFPRIYVVGHNIQGVPLNYFVTIKPL